MRRLTDILRYIALAVCAACAAHTVHAEPHIKIGFETDSVSGQKLIHAQALFPTRKAIVHGVFTAITRYPALHQWIDDTRLLAEEADRKEFLVEFQFPWPVGHQWSRVEVRYQGDDAMHWHQIEGSLKANRGVIAFTTLDGRAHIDYRAVIDVGLPDAWTRSYKKKFVGEFLAAVSNRVAAVTVATSTRP